MIIFVSEDISNFSLQLKLQPRVTKFPKSSTPRTPSFNATTQLRELQQLALTTQTPSTSQISTMRTESWSSFHSRYQSSRPNAADVTSPPSSRKSLGGRVVGSIASVVSGRRRQNPLQKSNSDLSSRTIYSLHDIECDMGMNFPSTSSRTISQSRSIRFE
jgi:hypothetical protein